MSTSDRTLFFIFGRNNPRVDHAEGYFYYDTNGHQYLDATSGAYNCVLGHTVPERVSTVIRRQMERLNFATMAFFKNDSVERLADRLLEIMPDYAAMGFYQSGSDAVEAALRCALQVAKQHKGSACSKIIGRRSSYHGSTLGTLALSGLGFGLNMFQREDFPKFRQIEPQDCMCCPFNLQYPTCGVKCASALEEMIEAEGPETIAAFVAEPSGRGGPVPVEYWAQIRAICDRYGILLVADEILEGLWRTGPAVALKRWGVVPDIIATGKVLGAGFAPIFPTLVSEYVRDSLAQSGAFWGGHAYSGHIFSCEIALAVLEEIESRQLSTVGVERVGSQLQTTLEHICEQEGTTMAVLGTLARIHIPCTVAADKQSFYLATQAHLQSSGLHALIRDVKQDRIEILLAPPFIADEAFFEELNRRLRLFIRRLPGREC